MYSSCCNSELIYTGICSVCKEHYDKRLKEALTNRMMYFGRKVFYKGAMFGALLSTLIFTTILIIYVLTSC
jgi:hypothetical protein